MVEEHAVSNVKHWPDTAHASQTHSPSPFGSRSSNPYARVTVTLLFGKSDRDYHVCAPHSGVTGPRKLATRDPQLSVSA
eukprot:2931912-Amphidinium_carterae.1